MRNIAMVKITQSELLPNEPQHRQ